MMTAHGQNLTAGQVALDVGEFYKPGWAQARADRGLP